MTFGPMREAIANTGSTDREACLVRHGATSAGALAGLGDVLHRADFERLAARAAHGAAAAGGGSRTGRSGDFHFMPNVFGELGSVAHEVISFTRGIRQSVFAVRAAQATFHRLGTGRGLSRT